MRSAPRSAKSVSVRRRSNHCRVQTQLVAKVLKDQAFVIARSLGNGVNPRPIEAVFRKTSSPRSKSHRVRLRHRAFFLFVYFQA